MEKIKLTFIVDPGHGWVKVSNSLVDKLGIAEKISSFSFRSKKFSFLEEDRDAGILLSELKSRRYEISIEEKFREYFNRNLYPRY